MIRQLLTIASIVTSACLMQQRACGARGAKSAPLTVLVVVLLEIVVQRSWRAKSASLTVLVVVLLEIVVQRSWSAPCAPPRQPLRALYMFGGLVVIDHVLSFSIASLSLLRRVQLSLCRRALSLSTFFGAFFSFSLRLSL